VATQTLTLARDRAGQKPLYYAVLPDGSLLYASELPALLASGLINSSDRDAQAFDHYWTMGFTAGDRTFYRGIRRLQPGQVAVWQRQALALESYWQVKIDPVEDDGRPVESYADELLPLLEDAVRLRLLSDVPVGICLSGGIDSTLMALMISRLRADVPAYTIAFENTPNNEAQQAAAIAAYLKLPHRILNVTGDLASEFPRIAGWYGEPFGDASSIPMYFLARLIREHATVALTGDGGDELFGGYHHYRQGLQVWQPGYLEANTDWSGWRGQARRLFLRSLGVPRGFARLQRQLNPRIKKALYQPAVWSQLDPEETLRQRSQWCDDAHDPVAAMQNSDFHVYMTDDVLRKVDRMSMAHALECRSPFMDYRIIEWAARLPLRARINRAGQGKWILRQLLSRHLPAELYDRPKQGFTPPWEQWCDGAVRRQLRSDWRGLDDAWIRPDAIDGLVPERGPVSPVLSWLAYAYVQSRQAWVS
jgi:asparagine synthase (glutamine-hydrolysing)